MIDLKRELESYGYKLESKIGSGLNGVVYLATEMSLNRHIVIKVSKSEVVKDWLEEVNILRSLRHTCISPIYDARVLPVTKKYFVTMPYFPLGDLESFLKITSLGPYEKLRILLDLADALRYLHAEKIRHMDIKPSNVFVEKKGNTYNFLLGDFGLATGPDTTNDLIGGTVYYVPPEIIRKDIKMVGLHSDVFSFGALIYFVLTGLPSTGTPIPPLDLQGNKELSSMIFEFLNACMHPDVKERIPDGIRLFIGLKNILSQAGFDNASKQHNIVVMGRSGAGKSSLINYLYGVDILKAGAGKSKTERGFHKIQTSIDGIPVEIFDSCGFDVGNSDEWCRDLKIFLRDHSSSQKPENWIHTVIFCFNAAYERTEEFEYNAIRLFIKNKYKVVVALTNSDRATEENIDAIKNILTEETRRVEIDASIIKSTKPFNLNKEVLGNLNAICGDIFFDKDELEKVLVRGVYFFNKKEAEESVGSIMNLVSFSREPLEFEEVCSVNKTMKYGHEVSRFGRENIFMKILSQHQKTIRYRLVDRIMSQCNKRVDDFKDKLLNQASNWQNDCSNIYELEQKVEDQLSDFNRAFFSKNGIFVTIVNREAVAARSIMSQQAMVLFQNINVKFELAKCDVKNFRSVVADFFSMVVGLFSSYDRRNFQETVRSVSVEPTTRIKDLKYNIEKSCDHFKYELNSVKPILFESIVVEDE